MNKISKKIVALVTMAAFVLTLVPVAAFAASEDTVATASNFKVVAKTAAADAGKLDVTVDLNKDATNPATGFDNTLVKVVLTNSKGVEVNTTNGFSSVTVSGPNTANSVDTLATTGYKPAADGTYSFTNLPADSYTVSVSVDVDSTDSGKVGFETVNVAAGTSASAYVYGAGDPQTSSFTVVQNGTAQTEVSTSVNTDLTAQFYVNDVNGIATPADLDATANNIKIWAIDQSTKQTTSALKVTAVDPGKCGVTSDTNGFKLDTQTANNGDRLKVSFTRPGTYVLYAGVGTAIDKDGKGVQNLLNPTTITVSAEAVVTSTVDLSEATDTADYGALNNATGIKDGVNTASYTVDPDYFLINGIAETTIIGTAKDATGKPAANETFTLSSSDDSGLILSKTEVPTDNNGQFKIQFALKKAADYKVFVSNEDMSFSFDVLAANTEIDKITTTASNAQTLLAGNDSRFTTTGSVSLEDAVVFTITDKSGNAINDQDLTDGAGVDKQPAAVANGADNHDKYLKIVSKPDASTLEAKDIVLAWSTAKNAYTLKYNGTKSEAAKDLVPGEYKVSVALTTGSTAEASFTLAKFGKVTGLSIDLKDGGVEVGDQVALETTGENEITGTINYVDENGIKVPGTAANLVSNVDGKAVTDKTGTSGNTVSFKLAKKDAYTENLIGTEVTVTAYDTANQLAPVTKTMTVVESTSDYTLAFDSESGEANKTNTVNVSVVNSDDKVVSTVTGVQMYAYVANSSNADAKVQLTPAAGSTAAVTNGKAVLKVYADKETVLDIVVAVKAADGTVYAKTLKYTVGEQDVPVGTSVVMTIGSNDFVVNNDVVNVPDAAPYVANDRTYVPFRALGEAIGADVVWDNDARTVTYTLGKTEVVMTIGEKTYTVNGEEKTMDVAPEITNDRTYVPVRFVGEALGFKVTALSAADGTTASVVFQK